MLAKIKNYQAAGFKLSYSNIRYGGQIEVTPSCRGSSIQTITDQSIVLIYDYDRQCFPAGRTAFLRKWLTLPGTQAVMSKTDCVRGYGAIRRCRSGYKIGPLFADDAEIAEQLYLELTQKLAGEQVFIDVPEINGAAIKIADKYRLQPVFATARMYNKVEPLLALDKIFGVTTFELG